MRKLFRIIFIATVSFEIICLIGKLLFDVEFLYDNVIFYSIIYLINFKFCCYSKETSYDIDLR